MKSIRFLCSVTALTLMSLGASAQAQTPPRQPDPAKIVRQMKAADYQPPAGIAFRSVTVVSEAVKLHGEVFTPADAKPGDKLPGIVMAHRWGGVVAGVRTEAADIARAGHLVLVFDYRGWGESSSRVILLDPEPSHTPGRT